MIQSCVLNGYTVHEMTGIINTLALVSLKLGLARYGLLLLLLLFEL